ncbi:Dolichyl-diphosphooligosaccharide-protein glycosyltransferase subunit dad1 [Ophidiomyces ophidiicola]|nr:Dolichyl-diphosphooligosaccharide-protein glycosyltransferase subunit dad1 [Ophidiomyces ophidiicola]
MSTLQSPTHSSYFEQQRAELLRDISLSFEQVLQNINRLNRNLESVIAVGNEFSSVEALWSQFENVMGKDSEEPGDTQESHHREEGSGKKTQEQEDRDRDDEKQGR